MTNKGKGKGKEVAGKASADKRKRGYDDDKTGGARKRNNRGVLQFFEEDAACVDESDESDFSDDSDFADGIQILFPYRSVSCICFSSHVSLIAIIVRVSVTILCFVLFRCHFFDVDFDAVQRTMNEQSKGQSSLPFVPKEELVDEEEFDRYLEERFRDPSSFIRFADDFDDKVIDPTSLHDGVKELFPNIWKVKCTVGRERLSAFSLMQKFADLSSLGTTLKIKSAFAVDHMKGFVFIEADRQYDINEACHGIPGIYVTRVASVPNSEVCHLFTVRSRSPEISDGMWVRIKGGNYKGDLAQVVAVNNTRKKVTVKLIPRIDLQALAAKFGGGYNRQKFAVPPPRLISSSELEEFRPLIQIKRDRDTGKVFEVLDGLMLKDGYVYKKVSPDSLSLWGVVPTDEELLKFGPSENNESNDLEWLSQLYGDKKKKRIARADKGGGKGESSSSSGVVNGFELYDLVCFGKKDFGVIVGMDKDDIYKILKDSSDGPVVVSIERHEIKSGLFDLKLTALDQHRKTILVNDTIKVLDGPSKGKQGIVKHIYRGIVFLYDGNEEEHGGYFTCKSNVCEKVKLAVGDCSGKESEPDPLVFEEQPSSPRSPLSPKKPWQARENNREFNRGDNNNMFTIGQSLRIRIGPLKGYLCRVIGLRRSDVTVKLDSQQKVLTVKCEHLSEVQAKSTAVSTSFSMCYISGDPDSSSSKPFDLLATEGSSGDMYFENWKGWNIGVGTSTGGGGWNSGGLSSERDAWTNNSAPSVLKPESTSTSNPFSSSGAEESAWQINSSSNQNSSWGTAVKAGSSSNPDQSGGWSSWGQGEQKTISVGDDNQKTSGDTTKESKKESSGGWSSWGQAEKKTGSMGDDNQNRSWGTTKASEKETSGGWSSWGQAEQKAGSVGDDNQNSSWNTTKASEKESSGWNSVQKSNETSATGWGDGNGFKSGSDEGNKKSTWSGWKSGTSGAKEVGNPSGNSDIDVNQDLWKSKPNNDGSESCGWNNSGKASDGLATGCSQRANWGTWKSGSGNENQNSHWSSGHTEPENQNSNSDKKNKWNSGNSEDLASDPKNSNWNYGSVNSNKSSWGVGNENKNSNWSSGDTDSGNQYSNQVKKGNWNSGNSGDQAYDSNNSKWSSGESNQNSNWGNKSSWNTGNENKSSNWSSVSGDTNQNTSWRSNSSWSTGNASSDHKLNDEGSNENSNGGGNWRGGSDRGGFRGRGFRGRGDRGGFGGRGDRGGRGGRGERGGRGDRGGWVDRGGRRDHGGFDGRGRSDREGFSGRWGSDGGRGGRGSGGWSNRRDSSEDGTCEWKNSNRSDNWNLGNADKEGSSWNQAGGNDKQWQTWSSASGGAKSSGWNKGNSGEDGSSDWKKGADSTEGVWKTGNGSQAWSQGGGSNNRSWSSTTGAANDNWNRHGSSHATDAGHGSSWKKSTTEETSIQDGGWNKGSSQVTDAGHGSSWKKSTTEETSIQDGGWNKGSSSNTASRDWDNQEAAWRGTGVSGNGATGSWDKRNEGGDKGGW
ncbi:hypothetical protein Fmac_023112 [Flemingia macrophylla]|uniref:KOW domain-containing protein n=1 Tax=Flemingia macrophylla TaxID=520843 RepID=A0ABD1LKL1_9FABA